jgi:ANTAR domain-containing protein
VLIWGEKDQIIPVEHRHEAQAARLGSHLEVLPEVGHFPHIEAPTKVADIIGEFIIGNYIPARCARPDALPDIDTQGSPPAQSLAEKLKDLLDRRATVDRAIGMLSSRAGLSAIDAFARLRDLSPTQKLGLDVAARRLTTDMVRESTRC